jgi:ketosteroid isomerase-like protein
MMIDAQSATEAVIREFWRLMATNDFHAVKAVLAPDLVVEWPQSAELISFFTVRAGKITRMVEYWPDPFPAAANRSHLVERMT